MKLSDIDKLPPEAKLEIITGALDDMIAAYLGEFEIPECPIHRQEVRRAAEDFIISRNLAAVHGTAKRQKTLAQRLEKALGNVTDIIDEMAPEFFLVIDGMVEDNRKAGTFRNPEKTRRDLDALRAAAATFVKNYQPKRGPQGDLPLEHAVRVLVPLMGGHDAVHIQMNKSKNGNPTLLSPPAKFIGKLLQSLQEWTMLMADFDRLTTTAVANMIVKVRNQPEVSEDHYKALFAADPKGWGAEP